MKKKIGVYILTLVMICTLPGANVVKADSMSDYLYYGMDDNQSGVKAEISDYILSEIHEGVYSNIILQKNNVAKGSRNSFSQLLRSSNANSLQNNYMYSASIDNEGEMKFCEFTLTENAKVSLYVQMAATLDVDVYLFSYEDESDTLVFVTGSVNEGKGTAEYMTSVLETGTYYIAFAGQEGTGNFSFIYYQSSADLDYELNDSISTASMLSPNESRLGVIDNPYDKDYYKITVICPTLVKCSFSTSLDYTLTYVGYSGEDANLSVLSVGTNMMRLLPGTYYFLVQSGGNNYSATSTYTIWFTKISECNIVEDVPVQVSNNPTNVKVQYDEDGKNCYVNGNPVNINYHYSYVSSVGSQNYDIQIRQRSDVVVDTSEKPRVVYYLTSTKPAMQVSARPAVLMTFISTSSFYSIHCDAMYTCDDCWSDFRRVSVLIDPDTGKLIDIVSINYFYDIAETGTNSLSYTTPFDNDTVYAGGN